jgi:hypothetical protein
MSFTPIELGRRSKVTSVGSQGSEVVAAPCDLRICEPVVMEVGHVPCR